MQEKDARFSNLHLSLHVDKQNLFSRIAVSYKNW